MDSFRQQFVDIDSSCSSWARMFKSPWDFLAKVGFFARKILMKSRQAHNIFHLKLVKTPTQLTKYLAAHKSRVIGYRVKQHLIWEVVW